MEIRQLKYFLEICRCRNITRAAQNLHISQQTLSRQIKGFEEELGEEAVYLGVKAFANRKF